VGVSARHGVFKARANTWAAAAEPRILRIWGIWVGSPLPATSSCASLLCLSPPRSLLQKRDAEAGLKNRKPSSGGWRNECLLGGGLCWDVEAAFGEDEGLQWGLGDHPWVLASG